MSQKPSHKCFKPKGEPAWLSMSSLQWLSSLKLHPSYTDPSQRLVKRCLGEQGTSTLSEAVSHGRDLIKKNKSWQTVLSPEQFYQPILARKARCIFTHTV